MYNNMIPSKKKRLFPATVTLEMKPSSINLAIGQTRKGIAGMHQGLLVRVRASMNRI